MDNWVFVLAHYSAHISDVPGNIEVRYTYDSWGKLISITDSEDNDVTDGPEHIGCINPLRYRGYYYDQETGLYYLNARYYDPVTGRFINADSTLSGGFNLFTYCYNNPIILIDWSGSIPTPLEAAHMAEHVYGGVSNSYLIGNWAQDGPPIKGGFGMVMGVYSRTLGNKTEYALVSKGTSKLVNWIDNLLQPVGMSTDMFCSKLVGSNFVKSHPDNEITFIGHSKGGAEALVNAWANNKNCIVFNPAAVNASDKISLSRTYSAKLTVFVVKGEVLTITRFMSDIFNPNIVYLNRKHHFWHTIKNHHIDAVIWGLENAGYN